MWSVYFGNVSSARILQKSLIRYPPHRFENIRIGQHDYIGACNNVGKPGNSLPIHPFRMPSSKNIPCHRVWHGISYQVNLPGIIQVLSFSIPVRHALGFVQNLSQPCSSINSQFCLLSYSVPVDKKMDRNT